jgi:endoglucanase
MKITGLLLVFIATHLSGCSQGIGHELRRPGKIPIDASRWYQLNYTQYGLEELFDGEPQQKIAAGSDKVLSNYDAWYPILEGEKITIDSIMMFDYQGNNKEHPTTIYAITDDWQKIALAVFTGLRYNQWNGPNPETADNYALIKPVSNIRYIVINSWGNLPGELEFYGSYHPPKPKQPLVKTFPPLRNFMGVNAFEWDFEASPDVSILDAKRVNAISGFSGIRHYMDWEKLEAKEGVYTFNPTTKGTWNYDTIYHWCKAQGIDVLACLKTIPDWMQESYPKDIRESENTPMRYGKDPAKPSSYIEQAKVAFQYAARYGNNKNIDARLISVGPYNTLRTGLGLINYIECDNERDKWWKGRQAYQTGREYAANLSAFYDGDKNKLGPGIGVKNADPSMQVVIGGLATPTTDYVRGIIDWSLQYRGKKPDGSPDLPFDIINVHYYNNDADYTAGKKQTTGRAPELTNCALCANNFLEMSHQYAGERPVWITETGYDISNGSIQKAPAINKKTPLETQADWILRTSLLYAKGGIQKVFFYELTDDNSASESLYGTSGLINGNDRTMRPAANFLYQTNKLFGNYTYERTLSKDPVIDCYKYNGKTMYVLFVPDEKGRTATYKLNMGDAKTAYIYTPAPGGKDMSVTTKKVVKGNVEIAASETPTFVTGYELNSQK